MPNLLMKPLMPAQVELTTPQPSQSPFYLTTWLENRTLAVTTQINEELEELLDSINDLEWLSKVMSGSDALVLPLGENGTAVTFRLGINETAVGGGTCVTSTNPEGGVCVPLPQCVLRVFKQDLEIYLEQYFCKSGRLAGVCCPNHLYGQKTEMTEKTYDTTIVVE
nr:clip domain serine protease [Coptotermes formosanus]